MSKVNYVSDKVDEKYQYFGGISALDFIELFEEQEQMDIIYAAKTDKVVALFWEKLKISGVVHIVDERVIKGILALESAGLIAEGRANEILNQVSN